MINPLLMDHLNHRNVIEITRGFFFPPQQNHGGMGLKPLLAPAKGRRVPGFDSHIAIIENYYNHNKPYTERIMLDEHY